MRKRLRKILGPQNIFVELRSEDKQGIIREMVERLGENGMIPDQEQALQAILEREAKMSTGMNNGVAIPHGKTDSVERLIVAVGLKRSGVDFDSTDGSLSSIFIMTVSPSSRSGPHIQFLAEVSKILRDAEARENLRSARSVGDVLRVFD